MTPCKRSIESSYVVDGLYRMPLNKALILTCLVGMLQLSACSKSNNLLLGRVEAQVGPYTVAVTDCYRTEVPPPQKLDDMPDGSPAYRFAPCKDADVRIEGTRLFV